MKVERISAILAVGAITMGASTWQTAAAESPHSVSANIGAVSNYIWRGVTQTDNQPAIQGGIDYAHSSGFSAGTWVSNVDFADAYGNATNYEWDIYAGFGQSFLNDDLSYNISLIYYAYPDARDTDFAEVGGSMTYKWITAGIAYTFYGQSDEAAGDTSNVMFDEGDLYYYGALDFSLPFELGLNIHGGYYDFNNNAGNDYGHVGVSISREAGEFGTFSLNYDQVLRDTYDEDPKLWVGWNKEF